MYAEGIAWNVVVRCVGTEIRLVGSVSVAYVAAPKGGYATQNKNSA